MRCLILTFISEENTSHFIIQKSSDSEKFNDLGKVKANGNSNHKINYSFNDVLSKGKNFYRLKIVDFDNTYKNKCAYMSWITSQSKY